MFIYSCNFYCLRHFHAAWHDIADRWTRLTMRVTWTLPPCRMLRLEGAQMDREVVCLSLLLVPSEPVGFNLLLANVISHFGDLLVKFQHQGTLAVFRVFNNSREQMKLGETKWLFCAMKWVLVFHLTCWLQWTRRDRGQFSLALGCTYAWNPVVSVVTVRSYDPMISLNMFETHSDKAKRSNWSTSSTSPKKNMSSSQCRFANIA